MTEVYICRCFSFTNTIQHVGGQSTEAMSLFDDIIDYTNNLEKSSV